MMLLAEHLGQLRFDLIKSDKIKKLVIYLPKYKDSTK